MSNNEVDDESEIDDEFSRETIITIIILIVIAIGSFLYSYQGYQGYYDLEPVEQEKFHAIYSKWQNFDQKEFDNLVANITDGKTDVYGKTEAIFNWMNDSSNMKLIPKSSNEKNFRYDGINYTFFYDEGKTNSYIRQKNATSSWIFVTRYGRCGEYSNLFNTLATAAKVEARMVQPYYENGTKYDHMWNEVRLENGKWVYVDTSWPTGTPIGKPCNYLENRIDKTIIGKIEVFNTGEDLTPKYIYCLAQMTNE